MASPPTIFWIDIPDDDAPVLDRVAQAHHARLVEVKLYSLAAMTYAALAQGPVVFVARTAQEASRALGIGVDEVLQVGEITDQSVADALARASARASARISKELRRGLFQDDDELAIGALAAAFGHQLGEPLDTASVECEVLASALSNVLDVADRFVESTVLNGPPAEARELAVRRLALPPSRDLTAHVATVRTQLRRASALASTLSALAGGGGAVPIAKLVRDVVEVMRADLAPWASVDVSVEGVDSVCVAPIAVAFVVSSLLVNALDAVRVNRREGRICVRLAEHENAVVLEVEDNGKGGSSDLRLGMFEPYFVVERANRTGLVRVRERLRRCGGDVMVDSDPSGTTVRVLFPTSTEDVVFERNGRSSTVRGRPPGRSD